MTDSLEEQTEPTLCDVYECEDRLWCLQRKICKRMNGQIKHMVNRFLGWKLPDNFNPDAGISFKAEFNEHTPWPMKHEPTGTNLFDYTQAEAMVRYMLEGLPSRWPSEEEVALKVRDALAEAQAFTRECPTCTGRGYHHGFGEDGCDPDWCSTCGGPGIVGLDEAETHVAVANAVMALFPPPPESGWRLWSEVAQPMRRIIAMYGDGSGACIYFHAEDGVLYDGEDGCEYQWAERDCFSYWAYLPRGYRLHVEDNAEPMTFPPEPKGPGDE